MRDAPSIEDYERKPIPTRDEIEACEDFKRLADLLDEYECTIVRIETCMRFPNDFEDREWFMRARSALILFTIARNRMERRMKRLGRLRGPKVEGVAPELSNIGGEA